jgi:hypothetical protein
LPQAVSLVNQAIEALILSQPDQYLWGYARYKTPRREATPPAPATAAAPAVDNAPIEKNKK